MSSEQNTELKEHKTFYRDGQPCKREFRKNGILEGERTCWYQQGQLWYKEHYCNGRSEGEYREWYLSGRIRTRAFFERCKMMECKFWHISGNLCSHEFRLRGKREGEYRIWDSEGNLRKREFYRNDEIIDKNFTLEKRNKICRLKWRFRNRIFIPHFNTMLILDLEKIARL